MSECSECGAYLDYKSDDHSSDCDLCDECGCDCEDDSVEFVGADEDADFVDPFKL